MPQTLAQPREKVSPEFRIQWTREDCRRFVKQGNLQPGKYELIEGDIIHKMGQKLSHSMVVMRLILWCVRVYGEQFVLTQASINVAPEDNPTSEPEPDVFVLNRPASELLEELPNPADLSLVIEVSDTTLRFDLSNKAGLYARAGIGEYWVLDVVGRTLIVHREPQNGIYQNVLRYFPEETLSPLTRPDVQVTVETFLPTVASSAE
ncbi:MAG: Uma2 family endonuclease [Armatimonadaceae bacterium]